MTGVLVWVGLAVTAAASAPDENLVPNGSFEKGEKERPAGWQRPDGLTSFWVADPLRKGRCLKIDTDVYKDEYRARQDEMAREPVPPARPKTPPVGAKYDTVAGVEGVAFYSDWIAVKPGQAYRLRVDVRTDSGRKTPKVFVKGYLLDTRRPVPHQRRVAYKKYLNCSAGTKWQTFETVFCPTLRSAEVQWMRIMLLPTWPPGLYFFDNVRVEPVEAPPEPGPREQ